VDAWGQSSPACKLLRGAEAFDVADFAADYHGRIVIYARHGHEELRVFLVAGEFGDLDVHVLDLRFKRVQDGQVGVEDGSVDGWEL